MIVYGSSLSPFVRKTLVFAAEKGLEVENRPFNPMNPDPEFLACSPFRKIPALKDGDFQICDSSAIVAYFDAQKPDPVLIPAEPKARARTVWLEEFVDTLLMPAGAKMFFNRAVAPLFLGRPGDLEAADRAEREEMPPLLDYVESVAPEDGFVVGDSLTLADIALASPFVTLTHIDWTPDPARYPKTNAYVTRISARESFQRYIGQEKPMVAAARQRASEKTTQ